MVAGHVDEFGAVACQRVQRFHAQTLKALKSLLAAAGLTHPDELGPEHIIRRVSPFQVRSMALNYRWVERGALLDGIPEHAVFQRFWPLARPDTFAPGQRLGVGFAAGG